MDKLCKNCKWWRSRSYLFGRDETVCDLIDSVDNTEDLLIKTKQKKDDDFFISCSGDTYGLSVSLITGPEFGCIKFEPK